MAKRASVSALKFPKPKRVKRTRISRNGTERLYGVSAHTERRRELFERAGGVLGHDDYFGYYTLKLAICEICHEELVTWENGVWIHDAHSVKNHGRHCDCLNCGAFGSRFCHAKLHPDGRIGKVKP